MFAVLNDVFDISVGGAGKPPMSGACLLLTDAANNQEHHPRADATFLLLHLLEQYSSHATVTLISCLKDFDYFKICGAKSGLRFPAAFKHVDQQFIGPPEIVQANCSDDEALKKLLGRVVHNIRKDADSKHVVVLADTDMLIDIGHSCDRVQKLIAALHSLCKETAIIVHMHSNDDDEENFRLTNFLVDRAHLRADCRAFKSGYSGEFDGELQTFRQNSADAMFFECVTKRFLYKVGDRRFTLKPLE